MAENEKSNDLQELLKPLYQRAAESKERLSKLEAVLACKKDAREEELSKVVSVLRSKLEDAKALQISEQAKALKEIQKLSTENAKLKYRIAHLVRSLKEADCKSSN